VCQNCCNLNSMTPSRLFLTFHVSVLFRHSVLQDPAIFSGVLRAKGCFWTVAEPSTRIDYSRVGKTTGLVSNAMWSQVGIETLSKGLSSGQFEGREAAVYESIERLSEGVNRMKSEGLWDPVTEDRRVDLVFIGDAQEMDVDLINSAVTKALLTDEEIDDFMSGAFSPTELSNPFAQVPREIML